MSRSSDRHASWQNLSSVLIVVAVAIATAKVCGIENCYEPSRYSPPNASSYSKHPPDPPRPWPPVRPEPTPMFSSNDKSRWATIRALVEEGTYVVGRRKNFESHAGPFQDEGIIFEPQFQSIDKVMNPRTGEFYSSKPPLFPTLLAGEYWLLRTLFGWNFTTDRWWIVITILMTVNVIPFAIYLHIIARLIEEYGMTDFGRIFTLASAGFATFLTTFSMTLNNHTPAACCIAFAIYPLLRNNSVLHSASLALSGFFAGFAATLELPALAFVVGLGGLLLISRARLALVMFFPAGLIPLLALLFTNYLAIGQLWPAYSEFGGPWYNFPGSHWAKQGTPLAKGIDFAQESKDVYAFHMLFGHHGWFSLTPIWLLSAIGLLVMTWRSGAEFRAILSGKQRSNTVFSPTLSAAMVTVVSIVVFAFYIIKTNNYGGFTSGPRWLFWLTPLWILALLPVVDRLSAWRIGRALALLLLAISVLSVHYPAINPWRPPWILQFLESENLLRY